MAAIIEVTDLHKAYDGRTVVDGVSFTVGAGEVLGLVGPPGAGKTTVAECVGGLRTPDSGRVLVDGLDPAADQAGRGGRVGRAEPPGVSSGTDRRLLLVMLALLGGERAVVLDEPVTGLDARARRLVGRLVADFVSGGGCVLLTGPHPEAVQGLCDRIAVVDRGRITAVGVPAVPASAVGRPATAVSFRPSAPLDGRELTALPGARSVTVDTARGPVRGAGGGRITVRGTDETVDALIALLVRRRIIAHGLRVTDARTGPRDGRDGPAYRGRCALAPRTGRTSRTAVRALRGAAPCSAEASRTPGGLTATHPAAADDEPSGAPGPHTPPAHRRPDGA
ncbi:ATP-binding cassette domain-containing protein [Streptomyces sp. NPDC020875]|uniref:ATP-binding cassette domain-containing protein n=1 Tax=Streptomyces sp. NPDC020875 TaxID=3154898 RepID=UPI0033C5EE73